MSDVSRPCDFLPGCRGPRLGGFVEGPLYICRPCRCIFSGVDTLRRPIYIVFICRHLFPTCILLELRYLAMGVSIDDSAFGQCCMNLANRSADWTTVTCCPSTIWKYLLHDLQNSSTIFVPTFDLRPMSSAAVAFKAQLYKAIRRGAP